jgi:hypothetical protein
MFQSRRTGAVLSVQFYQQVKFVLQNVHFFIWKRLESSMALMRRSTHSFTGGLFTGDKGTAMAITERWSVEMTEKYQKGNSHVGRHESDGEGFDMLSGVH